MWTKEQRKSYMAKWRNRNPNKIRKQNQSWRTKHNDYDKERKQKWYLENKERVRKQGKKWYQNNNSHAMDRNLQKAYGITLAQYNELLQKQNACCAICARPSDKMKKRLGVDHNHETGKIRGLLCFDCNYGLGYFKDNSSFLSRAISYLGIEDAR